MPYGTSSNEQHDRPETPFDPSRGRRKAAAAIGRPAPAKRPAVPQGGRSKGKPKKGP